MHAKQGEVGSWQRVGCQDVLPKNGLSTRLSMCCVPCGMRICIFDFQLAAKLCFYSITHTLSLALQVQAHAAYVCSAQTCNRIYHNVCVCVVDKAHYKGACSCGKPRFAAEPQAMHHRIAIAASSTYLALCRALINDTECLSLGPPMCLYNCPGSGIVSLICNCNCAASSPCIFKTHFGETEPKNCC